MQQVKEFETVLIEGLRDLIKDFINAKVAYECPSCGRMLNLPDEEDIENWLKGER